ncbi:hypothetical protein COCNU_14G011820 [Cocos nucifera]|uniref:Uncharacterized protein n=1 Tax=Cocos nucifera TaxID=13894 RepID=A0A8K0IW44_COCNU|nr:hypothetical protein COCNU_14G011820 [Cocos nucifera]
MRSTMAKRMGYEIEEGVIRVQGIGMRREARGWGERRAATEKRRGSHHQHQSKYEVTFPILDVSFDLLGIGEWLSPALARILMVYTLAHQNSSRKELLSPSSTPEPPRRFRAYLEQT